MPRPKGYKVTKETKRQISIKRKEFLKENPSHGFQKNNIYCSNWTGRCHKKETKQKISDSMKKKNPMFDKNIALKVSKTRKEKEIAKGKNNPNWKGGITSETQKIRHSDEYNLWRNLVFEKDDYTCQYCQARSGNGKDVYLEAHHIKSFAEFIDLRFDIDNGMTLCRDCHDKTKRKNNKHE